MNNKTNAVKRQSIRSAVKTREDIQKIRIQMGNRIVAAYLCKQGMSVNEASSKEEAEKIQKEADNTLSMLRAEYKRITDPIKKITRATRIDSDILTEKGELDLIKSYELMLESEDECTKAITYEVEQHPLWNTFLKDVKGVGPIIAGVIISEIDIYKAPCVSSIWKYAGTDVVIYEKDGIIYEEGRSRKKESLTDRTYVNKDGVETVTKSITFNPFLKTKLIGVLGPCFIKAGGPYKKIYDGYKHRLENHPKHMNKTKAHRHNMAVRYMIKEFLAELYATWRPLEGLDVRPRYNEEKLGIFHSKEK